MSQVTTELVIDSDTSGADRFSQSMDKAGGSARDATSAASSMSLAVAGVGVATIAALAGLRAFVDYVGNQTQALVDMKDHAELAGISIKEFQETLFAARAKGLTEKDFVSGLDKIGGDLQAASRGVTEFGKLFEVNGLSIKNANGELKTTKQAVADLAGLVQNAAPGVQQAIARIAGVSAAWVPFLKQGVEGIEEQKKAAADLGVIISDDMIAKAAEFNAQWKTAVATWDLQFKASLASILPLMIQLANLASSIIQGVGDIGGTINRLLTPDDSKSGSQLNEQINDVQRLTEVMQKFGEQSFRATNLKGALGLPEASDLKEVYDYLDKIQKKYDEIGAPKRIAITGGTTVLPPTGEKGNNPLDTEIERLEKHIAITKADTEAVGQSEAARAGLRAEATLYAAAERAGFTDLEKYAEQFFKIREAVEAATQELNKAQIAADIKFQKNTTFLSDEDVKIATQLKKLYPEVGDALSSPEAAAIRFNDRMKDIKTTTEQLAGAFANDLVSGLLSGKSGMDALVSSANALGKSLTSAGINNIIKDPTSAVGYIEAGVGIIDQLITGKSMADKKAAEELKQAQAQWAAMAQQVNNFNAAAKGFNLGPLTNQIQQLSQSEATLMDAAGKAHDYGAQAQLAATFNAGVSRIVQNFKDGAVTLSPMATAIKAVNDESSGLVDTLKSLHLDSLTIGVAEAAQAQIRNIIAQFTDQLTSGLAARLNTANGKGYLTDASNLLKQHQTDLASAAELGNNPAVLSQISAVFAAEAQKIVEDAGLVGDSFSEFVKQFPELSGVVNQSTTALSAANDKFKALTDTINQYLDSLKLGSNSILSPQDQLGAAQDQFNRQLGLAGAGDQTALGSITQYASALLDQAKSFYASSGGYTDIYRTVTAQLSGLTGGGPATGFSTPSVASPMAMSGVSASIVPRISVTAAASNDNGQLFSQQTNSLVQAIGAAASAEIQALKDEMALLRAQNERLIAAVKEKKPMRPNDRAA